MEVANWILKMKTVFMCIKNDNDDGDEIMIERRRVGEQVVVRMCLSERRTQTSSRVDQ